MLNEQNFLVSGDVPLGFGMALAQNLDAMQHFGKMTKQQQQNIIGKTKGIKSKNEMKSFVDEYQGWSFR